VTLPIEIRPAVGSDAGELWTVQLAAYVSEGRLHARFDIPPLNETLDELRVALDHGPMLKALLGTRSIGTRLLLAIEALLAEDVDRFELFTGPRSTANVRLYERLGYRLIPTPPGGEPAVYLSKPAP
jgi:hypothetical protein